MKKYESYKDSGIEWIGEIPEHWEVKRLRNIVDIVKTGSTPPSEKMQYFEPQDINWYGPSDFENLILGDSKRKISNLAIEENKCRLFPSNSILLIGIGTVGKVGLAMKASSSNQQINAIILKKNYNVKFYLYFLSTIKEIIVMEASSTTLPIFNQTQTKNIVTCVPPIEEQTTIANFIDHKTTQIDDLIAKKERLIQLLEEERVAVINQAVTKGLDLTVPMKDSGIEWLGEIPEHWESWKISHAFNRIGSGTTPESGNLLYHENGTISWLNTGDLNDSILDSCSKKITTKALEDYSSLKLYPTGSLVMAMYGATIGKTAILNFETTTNQACCVFCDSSIIDLKFLQYWFVGNKEQIINLAIGGGQPNISQNILKDIRVLCPDITEQTNIANYLDHKTTQIDDLIAKAKKEIELLKEYKTALISEVVTGKVDVRNEEN